MSYNLVPVDGIPKRRVQRRSKYDDIIDDFLNQNLKYARLDIDATNLDYIRTQIYKRIKARGLTDHIKIVRRGSNLYLVRL
ncbi:MAG: hypothetical protein DRP01_01715 [Archaeoglobales archaeon]|nr:MAG: hypothetical protein DRP01_01715 [Archaeoglobales archaeon]